VIHRLREGRPDQPEQVGSAEECVGGDALIANEVTHRDRRRGGGLGDADPNIGLGHSQFGQGDVRAALEQLEWDAEGDRRTAAFQRVHRSGEGESNLPSRSRRSVYFLRLGTNSLANEETLALLVPARRIQDHLTQNPACRVRDFSGEVKSAR
jgi:hypothetical protein